MLHLPLALICEKNSSHSVKLFISCYTEKLASLLAPPPDWLVGEHYTNIFDWQATEISSLEVRGK